MGISNGKLGILGCGFALALSSGVLSSTALAGVVGVSASDIKTEADCMAQEGFIVDAVAGTTCWVPLIPVEFQTIAYAADLKGVDSCDEKDTAATNKAGKYCKILLKPANMSVAEPVEEPVETTPLITKETAPETARESKETLTDKVLGVAKEEADKLVKQKVEEKAKSSLLKAVGEK